MKILLCQTNMKWTIEENVQTIKECLFKAAEEKTDLVLFPECAITGYHRQVPASCKYELLQNAFKEIQSIIDLIGIAAIIGSPYIHDETSTEIFNSALFFQPNSEIGVTSKIGLTDAEKQFFTKGNKRNYFQYKGKKIGIVFCREMDDKDDIMNDYQNSELDFIIWPSYIKWDNTNTEATSYTDNAFCISKELIIPIINVNAANGLNDDTLTELGLSRLIENGDIKFKAIADKQMLKVLNFN